jgi:hypothetical protein
MACSGQARKGKRATTFIGIVLLRLPVRQMTSRMPSLFRHNNTLS